MWEADFCQWPADTAPTFADRLQHIEISHENYLVLFLLPLEELVH